MILKPYMGRLAFAAGLWVFVGSQPAAAATTFKVTSTHDAGAGSLRQALIDANRKGGSNEIVFEVGGVIRLLHELPKIKTSVTIEGAGHRPVVDTGKLSHAVAIGDNADAQINVLVTIDNVSFAHEKAQREAIGDEGLGDGIFVATNGVLKLRDVEVLTKRALATTILGKGHFTRRGLAAAKKPQAGGFVPQDAKAGAFESGNGPANIDGAPLKRKLNMTIIGADSQKGRTLSTPPSSGFVVEDTWNIAPGNGDTAMSPLILTEASGKRVGLAAPAGKTMLGSPASSASPGEQALAGISGSKNATSESGSPLGKKSDAASSGSRGPASLSSSLGGSAGGPGGVVDIGRISPSATRNAFEAASAGLGDSGPGGSSNAGPGGAKARMQKGVRHADGTAVTTDVAAGGANVKQPPGAGKLDSASPKKAATKIDGAGLRRDTAGAPESAPETASGVAPGGDLSTVSLGGTQSSLAAAADGLGDSGDPSAPASSLGIGGVGQIVGQGARPDARSVGTGLAISASLLKQAGAAIVSGPGDKKEDPKKKEEATVEPEAKPGLLTQISNAINGLSDSTRLVIGGIIGVAALVTALLLILPFFVQDPLAKRMKSVASERERIRARERERLVASSSKTKLRIEPKAYMKQIVERFNLSTWLGTDQAKMQMTKAGYRGPQAEIAFLFFRLVTPAAAFVLGTFYIFVVARFDWPITLKIAAAIFSAYAGLKAPEIFLQNQIKKRQFSMGRAFPDAMDLLLICVESGMSIEHACRKVAQEIGVQSIPLAEEFSLTTAELAFLQDRRTAYENFALRTGLESAKQISTALIQAERYGTPLGAALRTVAQESRDGRLMEAEKKAAALPPKLTVPMIIFFLPVLFAVIMTPAIIQISNTNT